MIILLVLLGAFFLLGSVILLTRWYCSDEEFERRHTRSRIMPPYSRWWLFGL